MIEESDALDFQDAESTHAMLSEALDGLKVGLIDGRMTGDAKDKVMKQFAAKTKTNNEEKSTPAF